MKHSLLVSFISTLALSLGLVGAISTRSLKTGSQVPIHDAMGIASNQIVCRKHAIGTSDSVYNKREAYAAVAQAMLYIKEGKTAVIGCESLRLCTKYPKKFNDERTKFKTDGSLYSFPILADGKIFNGGRLPVRDLVIFHASGEVVGIVYVRLSGYTKCLIDDNFLRSPRIFSDRLKYGYKYYTGKTINNDS